MSSYMNLWTLEFFFDNFTSLDDYDDEYFDDDDLDDMLLSFVRGISRERRRESGGVPKWGICVYPEIEHVNEMLTKD